MLLRRISEHVNSQNWFAVSIDFIVVVVGIFLGFQLTEWNETRQLRDLKGVYLERLKSDLEDDMEELRIVTAVNERATSDIRFLEEVTDHPSLAGNEPQRFLQSFDFPSGLRRVFLRRDTFDELRDAGRLSLLGSLQLESSLIEYYSKRRVRNQWVFMQEDSSLRFTESISDIRSIDQILSTYPFKSDFDYEYPEIEFSSMEAIQMAEQLQENSKFKNSLPLLFRQKFGNLREAHRTRRYIEKLIPMIDAEILRFK